MAASEGGKRLQGFGRSTLSTKDGGELAQGGGEAGSGGFSEVVAGGVFQDERGAMNQQLECGVS